MIGGILKKICKSQLGNCLVSVTFETVAGFEKLVSLAIKKQTPGLENIDL